MQPRLAIFFILLLLHPPGIAQQPQVPKVVPVPPLHSSAPIKEPTDPPARDIHDLRDHLVFHLPPGWNTTKRDGELSSFHLDARTAPALAQLHQGASLAFNPYPLSTFAGAFFYISSTPHQSPQACAAETSTTPATSLTAATIDARPFSRGKDEHGGMCTEGRDVIYTAIHNKACLRFDLTVNTFCGGEASGAQDLTESQLQSIYTRLKNILDSVHFTD